MDLLELVNTTLTRLLFLAERIQEEYFQETGFWISFSSKKERYHFYREMVQKFIASVYPPQ
ncbi:MAG TPA: hypothetical protein PK539_01860 [Candidatus Paceibacterota bacterium]|nr:hypothetical protein [Candidatus Paceibacterota bacterium]